MTTTRREFLAASAAPLLCAADRRWNILWISCEDTSPDLGCYGDAYARTPNLDRFASQGARFTHAFTVAGVCAPSRSGIITGMYPSSIGTHHMRCQGVPPPFVKCFPEYLRAAGYYCSNNVKTDYNFESPVTAWDDSTRNGHWRNRATGQPFFSVFNITTTHESQVWPQNNPKATEGLTAEERHDPARAVLPPYYPDTPVVRRSWANYYDCVTAMDKQFAAILRQLDDDRLADSTIVFFWGDHGRGLPRAKRWVYDSGTRIPLLIRWPGVLEPGSVTDRMVSGIDFGPTVLSMAGLNPPAYMQGRAFLGDHAGKPREYVFAARDRMDETYDIIRTARDRRFRYVRNYKPGRPYAQYIAYMENSPILQEMRRLNKEKALTGAQQNFFAPEKPVEELYDIESDPYEIRNLAGDPNYHAVLDRMRAAEEHWMDEIDDLALLPEEELNERNRPGGKWQVAGAPRMIPQGGRFTGPITVKLECPTEGASLAWSNEADRWRLYSHPVRLEKSCRLRAKACRLGFKDSPEVEAGFQVG